MSLLALYLPKLIGDGVERQIPIGGLVQTSLFYIALLFPADTSRWCSGIISSFPSRCWRMCRFQERGSGTEYELYERFEQIAERKKVVYISHKLSFCRFCDRILVLYQGELVQSDSHDELTGDSEGW